MTHAQPTAVQDGLKRLLRGEHAVLLDSRLCESLPQVIMRLAGHRQKEAVDSLFIQVFQAARGRDKEIRDASSACLVAAARALIDSRQWHSLEKILPALQTIAGSPVFSDQTRARARDIISRSLNDLTAGPQTSVQPEQPPMDPIAVREEQIFQLAAGGDTEAAKNQLFDLIVASARKKDFFNAERLRERIYEIDPMALMEIIQANDIIEEEKSQISPADCPARNSQPSTMR